MGSLKQIAGNFRVKDTENGRPTDRWTNADILPVLPENRTYTVKSYMGFWVAAGVSATYWVMGSTAITTGLTPGQAIGANILGGVLSGLISWGCGEFGIKYGLGFPMMSRSAFGMYGSYFVIVLKCFSNFVYGIQTYWGGLAMSVMLSAVIPQFHKLPNTLPASARITTKDLIGTLIYYVMFVALIFVKPYKLHRFYLVSFVGVTCTIFGMFIWAMAANGGAGNLVAPTVQLSPSETAFRFFQAICTMATTYTGVSIRHSDWTRYSKTPMAARVGIWIACPLSVSMSSMLGVFVTSASSQMYGQVIWQPITLLAHIQDVDYSATTRAGTFFCGMGWFLSQLAVNISSNAVATGMDLASIVPQWIDARRGSLILAVIALASCPWNLVNAPSTFITVIGSLGIFISPLIGIYIADFLVVRRQKYKVPDMYLGTTESIYWYHYGFHSRAFVTWISIIWMSLPGFAGAISGMEVHVAWTRIFRVSFLIGLCGGFIIYSTICRIFPVPGAGLYEPYDFSSEGTRVLEADYAAGEDGVASEKEKKELE